MDDQHDVIDFLSRGNGSEAPVAVERIETPTAFIFLGDGVALKLKRAVRYPFLDQSTIERRRTACEEELRLNRRTAPGLYRDVVAVVRGSDGQLRLGGEGAPVDWLVRMGRFDGAGLFDRMADAGRLTPALLRQLADRIAAFHAEAPVTPDRGGALAVRRLVALIRESMGGHEAILPAAEAERWYGRALIALHRLGPLLDARRAQGRVRWCHGDLHLRNICLLDGVPTLFDCIEFSADLACIDTLYDLAFLLMDLWQRGLHADANLVFNRYADMSDDETGHGLLPFFMSLRAAVRAHVCAQAADFGADAGEARRARDYMATALACLDRRPPRLVAIGGLSGTGKSTLGHALAPELGNMPGARILRSDVLRKRLHGTVPEQRLPSSAYTADVTKRVYGAMVARAGETIRAGHAVVADAVFARADERAAIASVCDCFAGLWLEAPDHMLRSRVAARRDDASDADLAVLESQLARARIDADGWFPVAAGEGADVTLAHARAFLRDATSGKNSQDFRSRPTDGIFNHCDQINPF